LTIFNKSEKIGSPFTIPKIILGQPDNTDQKLNGISMEKLIEVGKSNNAATTDKLLSQSFVDIQYVNLGTRNSDN
jgi:hypothetical protein